MHLPLPPTPKLVRLTHKKCSASNCNRSCSEYTHDYCYLCASKGSIEWKYHYGGEDEAENKGEGENKEREEGSTGSSKGLEAGS